MLIRIIKVVGAGGVGVWIVEKLDVRATRRHFRPGRNVDPGARGCRPPVEEPGTRRPWTGVVRIYPPLNPPTYPHKASVIHQTGPVIHMDYVDICANGCFVHWTQFLIVVEGYGLTSLRILLCEWYNGVEESPRLRSLAQVGTDRADRTRAVAAGAPRRGDGGRRRRRTG